MKFLSSVLLTCLLLTPLVSSAAQVAQTRLYCVSVRLAEGRDQYGDRLNITSTGAIDAGLGELSP